MNIDALPGFEQEKWQKSGPQHAAQWDENGEVVSVRVD